MSNNTMFITNKKFLILYCIESEPQEGEDKETTDGHTT